LIHNGEKKSNTAFVRRAREKCIKMHGVNCENSIAKERTALIISARKNALKQGNDIRFVLSVFSVY